MELPVLSSKYCYGCQGLVRRQLAWCYVVTCCRRAVLPHSPCTCESDSTATSAQTGCDADLMCAVCPHPCIFGAGQRFSWVCVVAWPLGCPFYGSRRSVLRA